MWFYRVHSSGFSPSPGAFGVREVPGGAALAQGDFPALIVVPGLAFDRKGNRLGRGRAYYDRFFARVSRPSPCPAPFFALGYCTAVQLVPELPVDPWDRPMDALCTAGGFLPLKTQFKI
jgi:5-formyltetrahydrofolate cyclo-ligase